MKQYSNSHLTLRKLSPRDVHFPVLVSCRWLIVTMGVKCSPGYYTPPPTPRPQLWTPSFYKPRSWALAISHIQILEGKNMFIYGYVKLAVFKYISLSYPPFPECIGGGGFWAWESVITYFQLLFCSYLHYVNMYRVLAYLFSLRWGDPVYYWFLGCTPWPKHLQ